MKKIIIAILFSYSSIFCRAQADSSLLNTLADQLYANFNSPYFKDEEFGPIKILFANRLLFSPEFDLKTKLIRKAMFDSHYKNEDSFFHYLIPVINKIFLKRYLSENTKFLDKYHSLFQVQTDYVCQCTTISTTSKDAMSDNRYKECLHNYLSDTSLINNVRQTYFSLSDTDKLYYLHDALNYARINCPPIFNKLIVLANDEITKYYDEQMLNYKFIMLGYIAKYYAMHSEDSLKMIFPLKEKYQKEIAAIPNFFSDSTFKNPCNIVFENDKMCRISSYIVHISGRKVKILSQVVYEEGTDQPLLYVRSINIYPREKIQNVAHLEEELTNSMP